jgi:MATE family multidrug resistance protein
MPGLAKHINFFWSPNRPTSRYRMRNHEDMTQALSSTLTTWPRSRSFVSAVEARKLIALMAPITATALTNMWITDTVMMGWSGSEALAAGAVVSDLYSIVYYFMAGTLSASAVLMAQALGARRGAEVRRVLRQGFFAAAILTIPAFYLVWNGSSLLRMFGVEETVIELGNGYRQMMALTIVPMMFVAVWRNAFAALGRPKIFLVATLLALPANGIANAVFMFGVGPIPAMGVAGAGLSSAIVATGLAVGFAAFAALNTEMRQLRLFQRRLRVDKRHLAEIFRLGIPIGFSSFGEVGVYLLSTVIVSLFGATALAAHAITLRMAGVVYALTIGLSQAATVRVSYALGRGDWHGTVESGWTALVVGTAFGLAIFAGLAGAASSLPWLFLKGGDLGTAAVASTAASLLFLLGALNLAVGPTSSAMAILRGFKDTRVPMVLTLMAKWAIGMPVAFFAAFHLGWSASGVWTGLVVAEVATAALMSARLFRRGMEPHR